MAQIHQKIQKKGILFSNKIVLFFWLLSDNGSILVALTLSEYTWMIFSMLFNSWVKTGLLILIFPWLMFRSCLALGLRMKSISFIYPVSKYHLCFTFFLSSLFLHFVSLLSKVLLSFPWKPFSSCFILTSSILVTLYRWNTLEYSITSLIVWLQTLLQLHFNPLFLLIQSLKHVFNIYFFANWRFKFRTWAFPLVW